MKLSIDCQEVSRQLSHRQEARHGVADDARLRLHLLMCSDCRHADAQLRFIQTALRQWRAQGLEQGADKRPTSL